MRAVRRFLRRLVGRPPQKYQRMLSFDQAEKAAGDGYLDASILTSTRADEIKQPSLDMLPDFFAPFFAMLSLASLDVPSRMLRVLDFGGATGDYFDYAKAMFGEEIQLDWHVVETEMYVSKAREIGLRGSFHTSIDGISDPDIALFSGSLQYIKDWKAPLTHPKILDAKTIYIARTPMGEKYAPFLQTVEYQSATVKCPGAILPIAEISDALSKTHRLHASWNLDNYLGEFGIVSAPAMIWRRIDQ